MKMMGQDADGFGRPTTTWLALFPPCFREFLALRVKTNRKNKMGGRQKYTGKKETVASSAGALGYSCHYCYNNNFRFFLNPNSWSSRLSDSRRFFTALWQLSFRLWDPPEAEHASAAATTPTSRQISAFTQQQPPFCFHTTRLPFCFHTRTVSHRNTYLSPFTPEQQPDLSQS
jgi:hypothetical protein